MIIGGYRADGLRVRVGDEYSDSRDDCSGSVADSAGDAAEVGLRGQAQPGHAEKKNAEIYGETKTTTRHFLTPTGRAPERLFPTYESSVLELAVLVAGVPGPP
jgi:hypothetical protein